MEFPRARIEATASFVRSLSAIREDLQAHDPRSAQSRFDRLQRQLARAKSVLSRIPAAGHPARFAAPTSPSVQAAFAELRVMGQSAGLDEFREWVVKPYILIYAHAENRVLWLNIRHERQLVYDARR